MSDQVILLLALPVLVVTLCSLWVLLKISRHSKFAFRVSGLGVKVELTGGQNRQTKDMETTP